MWELYKCIICRAGTVWMMNTVIFFLPFICKWYAHYILFVYYICFSGRWSYCCYSCESVAHIYGNICAVTKTVTVVFPHGALLFLESGFFNAVWWEHLSVQAHNGTVVLRTENLCESGHCSLSFCIRCHFCSKLCSPLINRSLVKLLVSLIADSQVWAFRLDFVLVTLIKMYSLMRFARLW